jgi:hypothetical protein
MVFFFYKSGLMVRGDHVFLVNEPHYLYKEKYINHEKNQ